MFHPKLIEQFLSVFIMLCCCLTVSSQHAFSTEHNDQIKILSSKQKISIFQLEEKKDFKHLKVNQDLVDYNLLSLNAENISRLMSAKSEDLKIDIPVGNEIKTVSLTKANFLSPTFKVRKASNPNEDIKVDLGVTYRGKVDGSDASMVTMSFLGKEVVGLIAVDGNTYNLGKLKDDIHHVIYKENDLDFENKFTCFVEDEIGSSKKITNPDQLKNSVVDNCVSVYVETEFDVYEERGSVSSVTTFITSLFAQVSNIYANEDVNLLLGELFVWDIDDPYTGNSPSTLLNQFMDRLDNDFNGDIAHLINFEQNGGIAYVDALCSPFAYGTSGIDNFFSTVPTYSWSVNIIAHEIGHNLGSPHTHACAWNGNNTQIDGCGDDGDNCAQGPIPSAGTIMSYCHQVNGVGIDLSLGFGPQPGDLIRATVADATCLVVCGDCESEGDRCNDGDPCTTDDRMNAACNCVGTYIDVDLDGVCASEDPDDEDPCVPVDCPTCTNIAITIVLDNHPNETAWEIRNSRGTTLITSGGDFGNFDRGSTVTTRLCASDACYQFVITDKYGDGICCGQGDGSYTVAIENGPILITGGDFGREEIMEFCINSNSDECSGSCDDGDPCTTNDTYGSNCNCEGTPRPDSDGDGICDSMDSCPDLNNSLIGRRCDDGDECTNNDFYTEDCECVGTLRTDSDGDGVCNILDQCPDLDDALIGQPCDDGDPCTVGEVYDSSCNCTFSGSVVDRDGDGVCAAQDPDDRDECVPNSCSGGTGGDCTDVIVELIPDNYPGETRWRITNDRGELMVESPRYRTSDIGNIQTITACFPAGCYSFNITDSFGDGICCNEGNGGYLIVTADGRELISGGEFGRNETKEFCVSDGSTSECSGPCDDRDPCTTNDTYTRNCDCVGQALPDSDGDGICDANDSCPSIHNDDFGRACEDGDECTTGETYSEETCDCTGGTYIDEDNDGFCIGEDNDDNNPCIPDDSDSQCAGSLNCNTVDFADFESSWGIWRSGGVDATRARFKEYANSGEIAIRLRDNTDESTLISDPLDLSNYKSVQVTFSYFPLSMDNSAEDFWLQISTDGKRTYRTVEEWNKNDEFQNNRRYTGEATIQGPFTDETHLRFRCDASNNADIVFIDDILVERCDQTANNSRATDDQKVIDKLEFTVIPNPVRQDQELELSITSQDEQVDVLVYDILGKRVLEKVIEKKNYKSHRINTGEFENGTYLILVSSNSSYKVKKVMVVN